MSVTPLTDEEVAVLNKACPSLGEVKLGDVLQNILLDLQDLEEE